MACLQELGSPYIDVVLHSGGMACYSVLHGRLQHMAWQIKRTAWHLLVVACHDYMRSLLYTVTVERWLQQHCSFVHVPHHPIWHGLICHYLRRSTLCLFYPMPYAMVSGDLLYVPRGHPHVTCTTAQQSSIHLTFTAQTQAGPILPYCVPYLMADLLGIDMGGCLTWRDRCCYTA